MLNPPTSRMAFISCCQRFIKRHNESNFFDKLMGLIRQYRRRVLPSAP